MLIDRVTCGMRLAVAAELGGRIADANAARAVMTYTDHIGCGAPCACVERA